MKTGCIFARLAEIAAAVVAIAVAATVGSSDGDAARLSGRVPM